MQASSKASFGGKSYAARNRPFLISLVSAAELTASGWRRLSPILRLEFEQALSDLKPHRQIGEYEDVNHVAQ